MDRIESAPEREGGVERALRAIDAALGDVRALTAELSDASNQRARRLLAGAHARATLARRNGRRG